MRSRTIPQFEKPEVRFMFRVEGRVTRGCLDPIKKVYG